MTPLEFHHRTAAMIALSISNEQLEGLSTIYKEEATRQNSKPSGYLYNKCEDAIKANNILINGLKRELKPIIVDNHQVIDDAIDLNKDLFFAVISLEFGDQKKELARLNKKRTAGKLALAS